MKLGEEGTGTYLSGVMGCRIPFVIYPDIIESISWPSDRTGM